MYDVKSCYDDDDDVLNNNPSSYILQHLIVVSWKIPDDYTGDKSYYDPSWLIAENLDQNSLAEAFKKFPMDADPKREDNAKLKSEEKEEEDQAELDFSDDEEEEEEEEESDDEEEELEKSSSDEVQEYEEKEDVVKDPDVSHLEDSGKFY